MHVRIFVSPWVEKYFGCEHRSMETCLCVYVGAYLHTQVNTELFFKENAQDCSPGCALHDLYESQASPNPLVHRQAVPAVSVKEKCNSHGLLLILLRDPSKTILLPWSFYPICTVWGPLGLFPQTSCLLSLHFLLR